MRILPTVALIFCVSAMPQPSQALKCVDIAEYPLWLGKQYRSKKLLVVSTAEQFAQARKTINPFKKINPRKDHVEFLIPLIQDYLGVSSEAAQKLEGKYRDPLNLVFTEALERIKNKNLTYEYAISLPLRIGVFLETRRDDRIPTKEFGYHSYVRFEDFQQSLVRSLNYRPGDFDSEPPPANYHYQVLHKALENFDRFTLLPMFFTPNFALRNKLWAMSVYPISGAKDWFYSPLDKNHLSERRAIQHDLEHAYYDVAFVGRNFKFYRLYKKIENEALEKISSYDGEVANALQFSHHHFFPERALIDGFHRITRNSDPSMAVKSSRRLSRDSARAVLPSIDWKSSEEALWEVFKQYREILTEIIESHSEEWKQVF